MEFQKEKLVDALALMNPAAVARAAGVSYQTIKGWTSGRHEAHYQTLAKVAKVLGIEPGWFYEPYEEGVTKGGE